MKNIWQLQEAKNKLSEVINNATKHGPQIITKHGIEKAIVMDSKEYKKMIQHKTKLSTFFQNSPLNGVELETTRARDFSRDVDI